MRERRTYGSVRGALSNERPYRDQVALDPGDHRPDRRQLDLVVARVQHLGGIVERRPAVGARGGLGDHDLVGLLGQRAAATRPTQAALARPGAPLPLRPVRLVALGWR